MRITVSPGIRVDHDLVAGLVAIGFTGVEAGDVEVHVKAAVQEATRWLARCRNPTGCGRQVNFRTADAAGHCARSRQQAHALAGDPAAHHPPQRLTMRRRYAFAGHAYPTIPAVARVAPGMRYLVTVSMPADPAATGDVYPRISRYERYKTAPPITIHHWREELLHVAAHEARHTHQFRHRLPRSEIDAEHWAHSILRRCRQTGCALEPAGPHAVDAGGAADSANGLGAPAAAHPVVREPGIR